MTVNKIDDANVAVGGEIDNGVIERNIDRLAKEAGKQMKVDGFRKGKVPANVVKKLHGDKLRQDAESEALKALVDAGIAQAGVNAADIIGEPIFKKYDKTDDKIDVEVEISLRPNVDVEGYEKAIPSFEKPEASDEEVEKKLEELAVQQGSLQKIKRKRT